MAPLDDATGGVKATGGDCGGSPDRPRRRRHLPLKNLKGRTPDIGTKRYAKKLAVSAYRRKREEGFAERAFMRGHKEYSCTIQFDPATEKESKSSANHLRGQRPLHTCKKIVTGMARTR